MSNSNHLKAMRNTHINDSGRSRKKNKESGFSYRTVIDLHPTDKNRMTAMMREELKYYNQLISMLAAMSRAFPERYLEIDETKERLFGDIAYTGFDVRKIVHKTNVELPEKLKPYETLLLGKDSNGKRYLDERLTTFLENAVIPCGTHPQVKKNMAVEIFRFYKEQARIRLQKVPKMQQEEMMYKNSPQELETVDSIRKRHVQLPKSIVDVEWDEGNEVSKVYTPYNTKAIQIENVNLKDEYWNIMIIRQEPGCIPASSTPWLLETKAVPAGYLVKLLDLANPYAGSTFHAAKRRYT
jgi:hypothetical protein